GVKQMPAAYSTAPEGSTIILYTQEQDPETVEVPNFSGLTYTQTLARARALGLNIKPQGVVNSSGSVAASQSVAYGDVVELGTMITIQFVENDVADF
ncbi:MAG: PASTA domain-containing protein, partial [Oscillospiraceae bacterium]|nr:PASTA domain-containing protein [Oscillospiraceae bacterium]